MQNAVACPQVERFLVVAHATAPLDAAVPEGRGADWTSATGQVAVWLWPQGTPRQADGGLKLQLGGPGPVRDRFVDIDIDGAGRGTVRQDEFGLAPLYVAARDAFSFVSNRPDLIALAQHCVLGQWPERDHAFAALLAFKGFPMGERTGYDGVRCVPFLAHVQLSGSSARLVTRSSPPPWVPSRPASPTDLARAVDEPPPTCDRLPTASPLTPDAPGSNSPADATPGSSSPSPCEAERSTASTPLRTPASPRTFGSPDRSPGLRACDTGSKTGPRLPTIHSSVCARPREP